MGEISVDWITVTCDAAMAPTLRRLLERYFGGEWEARGSRGFYGASEASDAGLVLLHRHNGTDRSCVALSGQVLAELSPESVVRLLCEVESFGMRVTRLDLAIDYRGKGLLLVDHVRRACERKSLCGLRRWQPHEVYRGDTCINWGMSLGKRGADGSGRFVRVYDKGLEQGTNPKGEWQRFEAELQGDVAEQAVACLATCVANMDPQTFDLDDGMRCLASIALGSVDFRYRNGSNMMRRRRCAWWARVVKGISTVRLRRAPITRRLEETIAWLRTTVSAVCRAVSEGAGIPLAQLVCPDEVDPARATLGRARLYQRNNRLGLAGLPEGLFAG